MAAGGDAAAERVGREIRLPGQMQQGHGLARIARQAQPLHDRCEQRVGGVGRRQIDHHLGLRAAQRHVHQALRLLGLQKGLGTICRVEQHHRRLAALGAVDGADLHRFGHTTDPQPLADQRALGAKRRQHDQLLRLPVAAGQRRSHQGRDRIGRFTPHRATLGGRPCAIGLQPVHMDMRVGRDLAQRTAARGQPVGLRRRVGCHAQHAVVKQLADQRTDRPGHARLLVQQRHRGPARRLFGKGRAAQPAARAPVAAAQHRRELLRIARKQPRAAQRHQRQRMRQADLAGFVEHQQVERRLAIRCQLSQGLEREGGARGRHAGQAAALQHLHGRGAQLVAQRGHAVGPVLQRREIARGGPRRLGPRQPGDQLAVLGRDQVLAPGVRRRIEAGAQALHRAPAMLAAALLQRLVHRNRRQIHRLIGGGQQQHPGGGPAVQILGQQHAQGGGLAGARRPPQKAAAVLHQRQRRALRRAQPAERRPAERGAGVVRH